MSADAPAGPPAFLALIELATSMWRLKAVAVAVKLGIPELLEGGPRTIGELAQSAGAHEGNLYRLMRALARDGLFAERPPRTFALTEASRPLLPHAPGSVRNMMLWLAAPWMSRLWDRLGDAVRTDASVFRELHGTDIYPYLHAHPDDAAPFHATMSELTRLNGGVIAAAHDFSRFGTIVDVGGGAGEQMVAILLQHPDLRGAVFDAPEVASLARETLARHGVADRCEVLSGDLRETLPRGAGAYLLKNIVHDLSDGDAVRLLERCRSAMRPGGAVIVVQNVVPEGEGPYFQFLDLQLLLSGAGGKERTRAEFAALFSAAGLRLTHVADTPAMLSLLVGEV